jgi:23S rRNA (uracil1939-C5)-methyltransferase
MRRGPRDRRRRPPAAAARPTGRPARPPAPSPLPPAAPPARARPPAGLRLAELEEVELAIEKLVVGGEGFGRFEGIPIFVPRSAPGDRLRVRLVERHPDYGRGEIVAVLRPGPGRRPPPVPELAEWGGMDLQHLDDALQPRLKAAAAVEALDRLGGVAAPAQLAVVAGEAWGYRLRTQLHTESRAGRTEVGYHARGSHRLIPAARCPVLVPELERLLPELPALLAGRAPRRLDLAAGDDAITCAPLVAGLPHGEVTLRVGEFTYAFDARCFFQAHRGLLPRLVETVVGDEEGAEAYDLYAGVGLFTLPLARRYARVVAVEGDAIASRFGRLNARRQRRANVEVLAQSVESWAARLPAGADRVVVDPPRAGLDLALRRALRERRPRRITYVSCDPATLARDLRALQGVYRAVGLTFLDLFPQTGHLETVAELEPV